jgi:hypothetical protein
MSTSKKYLINNYTRVNISESIIQLIQGKKLIYKIISLSALLVFSAMIISFYFSLVSLNPTELLLSCILLIAVGIVANTKTLIQFDVQQKVVTKTFILFGQQLFTYKTFQMSGNTVYLKNNDIEDPYKIDLEHDSNKIATFTSSKTAHTFRKLINKKSPLIRIEQKR